MKRQLVILFFFQIIFRMVKTWSFVVPLTSQDSVNVAKVLYNEIFTRFGMPGSILSDQGHNCMSKLVSALCDIYISNGKNPVVCTPVVILNAIIILGKYSVQFS
jgi:hypothetical protein